ncbi:hypothetical protein ATCVNTS1_343R [Acanthocystis turfacea Chlorella virus NTS-1]|nr:hypothetical protein ATCVNTS1_343R [Acanthocystis turfacea Chlorella virus NTS-1]
MSSAIQNTFSAVRNFFDTHHRTVLKRDIPITGDDAELNTKDDGATVLTAIRDFFKTRQRVMTKRGIIATAPGDGTFEENGATKHKEDGVLVAETSEKIQDV